MLQRFFGLSLALLLLAGCNDCETCASPESPRPIEAAVQKETVAQNVDAPKLLVAGEIAPPLKLSDADWKKLPRTTIHAKEKDGTEVAFQGVLLREVLKQAGVKLGDKATHRERLLIYVVAEAADGYKIMFALQELEPDFSDKVVLIADTANDQPLAAKDGPLCLVVPDEKLHARWIRQLTTLKVFRARE